MQKIKSIEHQQHIQHPQHLHSQTNPLQHSQPPPPVQKTYKKYFIYLLILIYAILLSFAYFLQPSSSSSSSPSSTSTSLSQQQYQIAIIGTNDLHGKVYPTILTRQDTKQQYKYGGLTYLANAGDQFQGGIQASKLISKGQIMNDYFKIAKLDGSSIGNHQFDFGKQFLWNYLNGRSTPNLAANLQSENGQLNFLPHQKSSTIYTLPNDIKIGVIGLSTIQTLTTTSGFTSKKFPLYKFLPYKQIVIKQSTNLKSLGANAIILVSHMGDACKSNTTNQIRTNQSQQQKCPIDQLTKLINSLPSNTIHGVVQGHRHRVAHHYHRGIPYMGSINGGYYFNIMYIKFNKNKQIIDTKIQGPIPVCQKIFANTKKCEYTPYPQIQKAGQLINWQFHNVIVKQNKQIQSILLQKYNNKMQPYIQQIIQNQIYLYRIEDNQSQLSNLFTNLLHQLCISCDFTFLNTGGFRTEWIPGIIKYQQYFNMFPFDNVVLQFQITGKQLIQYMKIVQTGRKILQAWNLKMQINIYNNNNTKQLKNITFMNATKIQQNRVYKGASIEYLMDGGDLFGQAFKLYGQPKNIKKLGQFRSVLRPYLQRMKVIKKGTLIDVNNRRLIVHRFN